jgi:hypothetical protein
MRAHLSRLPTHSYLIHEGRRSHRGVEWGAVSPVSVPQLVGDGVARGMSEGVASGMRLKLGVLLAIMVDQVGARTAREGGGQGAPSFDLPWKTDVEGCRRITVRAKCYPTSGLEEGRRRGRGITEPKRRAVRGGAKESVPPLSLLRPSQALRPHTTTSAPTPPHTAPSTAASANTLPPGCFSACSHSSVSRSQTRTCRQ